MLDADRGDVCSLLAAAAAAIFRDLVSGWG
jgi:hypothetical protein